MARSWAAVLVLVMHLNVVLVLCVQTIDDALSLIWACTAVLEGITEEVQSSSDSRSNIISPC